MSNPVLDRHNELAAEEVKRSRSCCVYKYPNPSPVMMLPRGARPLFSADQNGVNCLWALVDPEEKSELQPVDHTYLRYVPDFSMGLTDYWMDVPVNDDIEMQLPIQHRLLEGHLKTSSVHSVRFSLSGPYNKESKRTYLFRLAGTGHPIGKFEARLLKFACPVVNEDLSLVQHLFYVGVDALS